MHSRLLKMELFVIYGGDVERRLEDITLLPIERAIKTLPSLLE